MFLNVVDSVEKISAPAWDALAGTANPFLRHDFLAALERGGCIKPETGWTPQFLTVTSEPANRGTLLGAAPMYLKQHSYGEYIFDWAWAGAYTRANLPYYPKLIVAIPFTPATGARLLLGSGPDREAVAALLIDGARRHAEAIDASSVHWLFTTADDSARLEQRGYLRRVGCQFHWQNQGYKNFDEFLAQFAAQKRKKTKRERRFVQEAGVSMEAVTGADIQTHHWQAFYTFYRATIAKHGAIAYLTYEFFLELGARMAANVVLMFARHDGRYVAGALNLRGADTLYGRYWGALESFHSLHFETCYYSAIEYCIAHGIARFEAGAQGEHKLARGFLPAPIYSMHWLSRPEFNDAVADFLAREQNGVAFYMNELNEHSPFKKDCL